MRCEPQEWEERDFAATRHSRFKPRVPICVSPPRRGRVYCTIHHRTVDGKIQYTRLQMASSEVVHGGLGRKICHRRRG